MTTAAETSRKALGRGLSTLLPSNRHAGQQTPVAPAAPSSSPLQVPIEQIVPNPLQPRTVFASERLNELAQSIRENGIIQPLIVRSVGGHYQLVAGERRLRAAKIAQLAHVPVIVQDYADDRLMEITLIENIQREDLNPIEVAQAFDRLSREHQLSHEQIAKRTGKDRTTVTNTLRLLRLPHAVQVLLAEHRLSMGHARALLALPEGEQQIQLGQRVASEGLSVRQVEKLVQRVNEPPAARPVEERQLDPNTKAAIEELERTLGTRVRIQEKSSQRGKIEIEYYSQEDLNRIYDAIVGLK